MKYCGLDVGSSRLRLLNSRQQLVVDEANCLILEDSKHIAWGEQVYDWSRHNPDKTKLIIWPFKGSSINNYSSAVDIISAATRRLHTTWLRRPSLIASVSAGSSNVERQAFTQALHDSGLGQVILIPRSVLSILGSQVSFVSPRSIGLVEIGAGSSELAVISYGNLVTLANTNSSSGDLLEQNLQAWLQKKYRLQASSGAVKAILHSTDALSPNPRRQHRIGKNSAKDKATVTSSELAPLIHENLRFLIKLLQKQLATMPIQTLADIMSDGLLLSGGVANMRFIARYMSEELKVPVHVVPNPSLSCLQGIKFVQKNIDDYQSSLLYHSIENFLS